MAHERPSLFKSVVQSLQAIRDLKVPFGRVRARGGLKVTRRAPRPHRDVEYGLCGRLRSQRASRFGSPRDDGRGAFETLHIDQERVSA